VRRWLLWVLGSVAWLGIAAVLWVFWSRAVVWLDRVLLGGG
jgi:hypothetical protein